MADGCEVFVGTNRDFHLGSFTCSEFCQTQETPRKCVRAQDNVLGCRLDDREGKHARQTTSNYGCDQSWKTQVCVCGRALGTTVQEPAEEPGAPNVDPPTTPATTTPATTPATTPVDPLEVVTTPTPPVAARSAAEACIGKPLTSCSHCSCVPDDGILCSSACTIGNSAFNGCSKLKSVSLPQATELGLAAFAGCTSLESVSAPQVTELGVWAFSGCTSLASVSLPQVTELGVWAFYNCESLRTVTIPQATHPQFNDGCTGSCQCADTTDCDFTWATPATTVQEPAEEPCDVCTEQGVHVQPGHGTLQTAVDGAADGAVLVLADGTYTGGSGSCANPNDVRDKACRVLTITKGITLRACHSKAATLDGEGARGVIRVTWQYGAINAPGKVTLDGLNIQNGADEGGPGGGGMFIYGGTVSVVSSQINNNQATYGAAGVFIRDANVDFQSCIISSNTASTASTGTAVTQGGGMFIMGSSTQVSVTDSTISGNRATSGGKVARTTSCTLRVLFSHPNSLPSTSSRALPSTPTSSATRC